MKIDFDSKESFTVYYMVTDILFWMLQFMTEMKETAFIMQNVTQSCDTALVLYAKGCVYYFSLKMLLSSLQEFDHPG